ncbi:TetR/AcrR family transcriptional regulator C-terminal domain-containing protein [Streptomyces sp. NPDC056160]|uniref:TetR/AcrR family transcriptional regulator C-terminal domain-containing protein n=1 Tax=Streptomyces sp. NPDC056160 TaxID=3345731 RepID=UPI0035E0DC6F
MATRTRRSQRRTEALSRERIVEAAVELLDAAGESGLTFRALTERLATGPGAIYWHVANKDELLGAVTEAVVAATLAAGPAAPAGPGPCGPARSAGPAETSRPAGPAGDSRSPGPAGRGASADSPQDAIRAVALGLFEAIEDHPWLATQLALQLSRNPWGPVTPRIFESVGRQVRALDVPESSWFTATSALVHYVLGAAGQNAANSAGADTGPHAERAEFLDTVSSAWEQLDPEDYPFTRAVADQVRGHDDREQFLSGLDLVLAGITALHPPRG